jgi:hypothetical protein
VTNATQTKRRSTPKKTAKTFSRRVIASRSSRKPSSRHKRR